MVSGESFLVDASLNHLLQAGIVSFGPYIVNMGHLPCDASIPGVYTRVAAFTDWIKETVQANGGW